MKEKFSKTNRSLLREVLSLAMNRPAHESGGKKWKIYLNGISFCWLDCKSGIEMSVTP